MSKPTLQIPGSRRALFSHCNGRKTTADDPFGDSHTPTRRQSFSSSSSQFDSPPLFELGLTSRSRSSFLPSIPETDSRSSSRSRGASRYLSLVGPGLESDHTASANNTPPAPEFTYAGGGEKGKGKGVAESSGTLVRDDDEEEEESEDEDTGNTVSVASEIPKRVIRKMASRMCLLPEPPKDATEEHVRVQSLDNEHVGLTAFSFREFQQWSTSEEPFRIENPSHSVVDEEESQRRESEVRPPVTKKQKTEHRRSTTHSHLKKQVEKLRDMEGKLWPWKQNSKIRKLAIRSWQKVKRIFTGHARPNRVSRVSDWIATVHEDGIEMQDLSSPADRSREEPDSASLMPQSRSAIDIQRGFESEQVLDDMVVKNWLSADRGLYRVNTRRTGRERSPGAGEDRIPVIDRIKTRLRGLDEYSDSDFASTSTTPPKSGHWLSGRI